MKQKRDMRSRYLQGKSLPNFVDDDELACNPDLSSPHQEVDRRRWFQAWTKVGSVRLPGLMSQSAILWDSVGLKTKRVAKGHKKIIRQAP